MKYKASTIYWIYWYLDEMRRQNQGNYKMKKFSFLIFSVILSYTAIGQSVEDSVKLVVNKMFAAMKSADQEVLLDCFADSAILQTVAKNKEGKVFVKNENIAGFAKQISALPEGAADERITFDIIKVDRDLASVWTPYKFYFNGKFSHCGVNSFQLVRINGEWKIQYIIDTRRKDSCK